MQDMAYFALVLALVPLPNISPLTVRLSNGSALCKIKMALPLSKMKLLAWAFQHLLLSRKAQGFRKHWEIICLEEWRTE